MTRGIAFVDLTNARSGTEKIVLGLAQRAAARGELAGVVLPNAEALAPLAKDLQSLGPLARIHPVTSRKALGANAVAIRRALAAMEPGLVHFHCPSYRWGLDTLMGAGLRKSYAMIRTEHNPLMVQPGLVLRRLLRVSDAAIDRFTYVSDGNQQRFEAHLPYRRGRGTVVRNGIDLSAFKTARPLRHRGEVRRSFGFPEHCKISIYVGSFGGRRSLRTAMEALAILSRGTDSEAVASNWRLLVVGEGDQNEVEMPQSFGVAELVHFAGRRNDVPALLAASDLFVTASDFEGLSLSMLEAWASDLPILSTPVDGVSDIVGNEVVRLITAQHGDAVDFARQWRRYMNDDPELTAIHRSASRRVRDHHSADSMLDNYERLYADVLKTRSGWR